MSRLIDPQIEKDINALMVCAPLGCVRESSCFRVARFARDQVRKVYSQQKPEEPKVENNNVEDHFLEQYAMTKLYGETGSWESV